MDIYKLLPELKELINNETYYKDSVGRSNSEILMFTDKVLKIREQTEETENEIEMLEWLDGKLPVPSCLFHQVVDGVDYLLMTRVQGEMACDPGIMSDPESLTAVLASCLQQVWSVDIEKCPAVWNLDRKLSNAYQAIQNGEVDVENAEPETFGKDGFKNPADLHNWLVLNKPDEDLVLSHGDFCLPNVFLNNGKLAGLIDLGRTGVADRWQDIALCYRSLKHNYCGKYGGVVYPNYNPDKLFEYLEIEPDWEKLNYYILLDELF